MTRTVDFKCKIIILNFPQKSKFKNKNYILKLQNSDNNGARCELILLNHMNSKQNDKNKKKYIKAYHTKCIIIFTYIL